MTGAQSARQPNFSQLEIDVLDREVQACNGRIYGHANRSPRADDAKAAWEEVFDAINRVCPNTLKNAAQYNKRTNDVTIKAEQKLALSCREKSEYGIHHAD